MGKTKWKSEPCSIGIGLWPYGHIPIYPTTVMVDISTIRHPHVALWAHPNIPEGSQGLDASLDGIPLA